MEKLAFYIFLPYLYMILWLGIFLVIFKLGLNYLKNRNKRQIKKSDKIIYYRDIPCFENIDLAYWILYNFSNSKKNDLNNGLIGAYLLKWYKNGYIDIKHSQNIDLKDGKWPKNYVESRIYNFLKKVAGNNNTLEKNEIRDYCSVDGNKFELEFLFKNILREIQEDLAWKKYITVIPSKNYIFFKTQDKITLSEELINEYQKLNGLKNFLLDYSNIDEKRHIEVHLWEEYLIFANVLGIADKVKQQFKKIYPNFNVISNLFEISLDNTITGHMGTIYKSLKRYFVIMVITVLLCILLFFSNR